MDRRKQRDLPAIHKISNEFIGRCALVACGVVLALILDMGLTP